MEPLANDPIMSGTLIRSFRHLELIIKLAQNGEDDIWQRRGFTKALIKSAQLFPILEFLKNLWDANIGTNKTENMSLDINREIGCKVGRVKEG